MSPGGLIGFPSMTLNPTIAADAGLAPGAVGPPVIALDRVDVPAQSDGSAILVHGVTWEVCAGERWLVSGGAGSGKSTVLQLAAGLVRPISGRHWLFGAEVSGLNEHELLERRSRVGVVFSGGGRLFQNLTVGENLALPLLYHARRRGEDGLERVAPLLAGLGLEEYARRLPRELPRRIAPRVALARALVLQPEVLLLDDPVAGLVAEEAEWWCGFLADCDAGRSPAGMAPGTWVLATQDSRHWRGLANRSARVENGAWQSENH